ncbi:MAG TPA: acetate/propionate family kinase [Anaerolineales bacterium]|nr:acetate/propionate family kinase [Anaerolineales bacterium]
MMNVLIFNCGSSSQAFKVFQVNSQGQAAVIAAGKARNVATQTQAQAVIEWNVNGQVGSKITPLPDHRLAAEEALAILRAHAVPVDAVGHRFVHGGEIFQRTTRLSEQTRQRLQRCLPLAPIHNPNSYHVIEVCAERLPGIPQYVVFDTAFHTGMPPEARQYAIPTQLAAQFGFRKYGFHGLSCQSVSGQAAALLGKPLEQLKLILCHLGTGGSSVTALQDGHTLDTSMGYSPLAGLVMSTRCGDIDAEIVLALLRQGYSAEEVSQVLNYQSGLIGLSGFSSNLAEIIDEAEKGNTRCQAAFEVYAHRLKTYLGAYNWLLNGADAILFTDDIGMRSWKLRQAVCTGAENLGVILDLDANQNAPVDRAACISRTDARTQVWVIPTDEEQVILQEVLAQYPNPPA